MKNISHEDLVTLVRNNGDAFVCVTVGRETFCCNVEPVTLEVEPGLVFLNDGVEKGPGESGETDGA